MPSFYNSEARDPNPVRWEAELPETSVVTVPGVQSPLSAADFQLLRTTINPLAPWSSNGKDLYAETVEFVGRCILNSADETA